MTILFNSIKIYQKLTFFYRFANGKHRTRVEQAKCICNLFVLVTYIFSETILFAQACTQCFLKETLLKKTSKNPKLMLKIEKWREMVNFMMSCL